MKALFVAAVAVGTIIAGASFELFVQDKAEARLKRLHNLHNVNTYR